MELVLQSYADVIPGPDGKFHPAICNKGALGPVYYWPNVTFASANEAYQHAQAAINDAQQAMNEITKGWNVVKN